MIAQAFECCRSKIGFHALAFVMCGKCDPIVLRQPEETLEISEVRVRVVNQGFETHDVQLARVE